MELLRRIRETPPQPDPLESRVSVLESTLANVVLGKLKALEAQQSKDMAALTTELMKHDKTFDQLILGLNSAAAEQWNLLSALKDKLNLQYGPKFLSKYGE